MARMRRMSKGARIINSEEYSQEETEVMALNTPEDEIIAEDMEVELANTANDLEEVQEEIQANDEVAEEVEEQIEENEEVIENGTTEEQIEQVEASTESLHQIIGELGYIARDVHIRSFNIEDASRNPKQVLVANNEALGDIWGKIKEYAKKAWEMIKKFVRKIIDFFKKLLPTRKNKLLKLQKILKDMDGTSVHEDTQDEWESIVDDKFIALSNLTGGLKTDKIVELSRQVSTILEKNVEGITNDISKLDNIVLNLTGNGDDVMTRAENMLEQLKKLRLTLTETSSVKNTDLSDEIEKNDKIDKAMWITMYPAGSTIKGVIAGIVKKDGENEKNTLVATKNTDIDNLKLEGKSTLDKSDAKSMVDGRLEEFAKTDKALSNLQKKLDKIMSNLTKAYENAEKETKNKADTEKETYKKQLKAMERLNKAYQTIFTGYVTASNAIDKETYTYITQFAAYTIKGIKKKNNEKDDKK